MHYSYILPVEEGEVDFTVLKASLDYLIEFELYQNLYCTLSLCECRGECVECECVQCEEGRERGREGGREGIIFQVSTCA